MSARQDIHNWVVRDFRVRRYLAFAGSVACLFGSFVAFWMTWYFLLFVIVMLFRTHLTRLESLTPWLWGMMAVIVVAYLFVNRRALEESMEFNPVTGHMATYAMRFDPFVGGLAMLMAPKTALSLLKLVALLMMAFPALAVLSWKLLKSGMALMKADTDLISRGLLKLAKASKRLPLIDFTTMFPQVVPATLLTQMALVDGVIIREEGNEGIYMTESLREDLIAARNVDA